MNVSAFLSSDTVVSLCINCFVSTLWHHVRGTNASTFILRLHLSVFTGINKY